MINDIESRLSAIKGNKAIFYKNLVTGEYFDINCSEPMLAASVIKLFVMTEAFRQRENGTLDFNSSITVSRDKCVPSCGALTYMHEGLSITVLDLVTLMIILSDNTATNYLIDMLGIDNINSCIRSLGYEKTVITRKMFDSARAALGFENYICPSEVCDLLERIYRGTLISGEASAQMLSILKNQRLNGKIPFLLHSLDDSPSIAHKTGEDDGITHDVGIVFAKEPFIVAFCGNEVDVPAFERFMQDTSLELFWHSNG